MPEIKVRQLGEGMIAEMNAAGTNYKVIAFPWWDGAGFNLMGSVSPGGWLVINCNTGRAALFQRNGYLANGYIQKHLGGFDGDYPYFGDLVRAVIGREEPSYVKERVLSAV